MNDQEIIFESKDALKEWLKNREVDEQDAAVTADKLFAKGFNKASRLIGITVEMLKEFDVINPLALELSNKLEKRQQQNDIQELAEFVRSQKRDLETLVLSKIRVERYNEVVHTLGLQLKGATWDVPESLGVKPDVPDFTWLPPKENNEVNRTAYMAHLRQYFTWPSGWELVDGEDHNDILSVTELVDGNYKTSGNIDVIIEKNVNVANATLKQNIEAQIELKKDTNKENPEKQVVVQHLAASSLNPQFGVLTLMTDLHDRWHFYWFGLEQRTLLKLVATRQHASYLLEHMFDDVDMASEFPIDFLSRGSWTDFVGLRSIPEGHVEHRHESGDKFEDAGFDSTTDVENSGHSPPPFQQTKSSNSKPNRGGKGGSGNTHVVSLGPWKDVANELDLLDFMGEEEKSAELFRLIVAEVVPRMVT